MQAETKTVPLSVRRETLAIENKLIVDEKGPTSWKCSPNISESYVYWSHKLK